MDEDSIRLISERQDRTDLRLDAIESQYKADSARMDEWRSAVDKQIVMIPYMTKSFQRMTQLAGATVVAVIAAAMSIIFFGGSP